MTSPPEQTEPQDIVIFGGAGDLSFRKLLPALYMAHSHDKLSGDPRIIGVGRQDWSDQDYRDFIHQHSPAFIEAGAMNESQWQGFLQRLLYVRIDITQASDFQALKALCPQSCLRVFYLATAPSLFTGICAHLSQAGLVDAHSRVVLEKPLGTDLASARQINTEVAKYFDEKQIYRIDHYLGKETVPTDSARCHRTISMGVGVFLDPPEGERLCGSSHSVAARSGSAYSHRIVSLPANRW